MIIQILNKHRSIPEIVHQIHLSRASTLLFHRILSNEFMALQESVCGSAVFTSVERETIGLLSSLIVVSTIAIICYSKRESHSQQFS